VSDEDGYDQPYDGSAGDEIAANGGRTGRGDELRSFTLPFELEADDGGRSDGLVELPTCFESFAAAPEDSRGGERSTVGLVRRVLRRLEAGGAEKDCSNGFGSRSKSERTGRVAGLW
jgi:hypothetical protein